MMPTEVIGRSYDSMHTHAKWRGTPADHPSAAASIAWRTVHRTLWGEEAGVYIHTERVTTAGPSTSPTPGFAPRIASIARLIALRTAVRARSRSLVKARGRPPRPVASSICATTA